MFHYILIYSFVSYLIVGSIMHAFEDLELKATMSLNRDFPSVSRAYTSPKHVKPLACSKSAIKCLMSWWAGYSKGNFPLHVRWFHSLCYIWDRGGKCFELLLRLTLLQLRLIETHSDEASEFSYRRSQCWGCFWFLILKCVTPLLKRFHA